MTERMSMAEYQQMTGQAAKPYKATRSKDKEMLGRWLMLAIEDRCWQLEFRFHPTRQWRFDWAMPHLMVAVEFEGKGIGHFNFADYSDDCEKYSEAAILGWKVIRVTAKMVGDGRAFDLIKRAITAR